MHKAAKQPMANSPDSARVFTQRRRKELAGLLENAQRLISRHAVRRPGQPGNLHMTLRFIGTRRRIASHCCAAGLPDCRRPIKP